MDGVHYGEEVYTVIAQMVANAFVLNFPYINKMKVARPPPLPKPTGAMSFPLAGAAVLLLSAIMLVTMDSFFGMYIYIRTISCIK